MMKYSRNILIVILFITVDLISGSTVTITNCDLVRCRSVESQQNATKPLELGERYVINETGCCPVVSVICEAALCPPAIEQCKEQFYELNIKNGSCCTTYSCEPPKSKCVAKLNGTNVLKDIGEEWFSTNPCVLHKCIKVEEYLAFDLQEVQTCPETCPEGYQMMPHADSCCPKCVEQQCAFEDSFYVEGDSWKSADNCTFYECELRNDKFNVVSYKKSCPKLSAKCLEENIYWEDCCRFCKSSKRNRNKTKNTDEATEIDYMNADTYKSHPCHRDCIEGQTPMMCSYTFLVEWYETLSKACYECPGNITDCSRPHCIPADGVRRSVVVVNRMMPGPAIEVCQGDVVSVDVKNHLIGDSTTLHWHGMHQRDSPYMDGVPHISQCPIPPGGTFRYTFKAKEAGTHFWHSHTGMQRGDGAFGALIVRKPSELEANAKLYNFDVSDHMIILQDWAHQTGVSMFSSHHHSIGDNKPPNILINGKGKYFLRKEKQPTTPGPIPTASVTLSDKSLDIAQDNVASEITESASRSTVVVDNNIEVLQIENNRNSRLINGDAVGISTPELLGDGDILSTTEYSTASMVNQNQSTLVLGEEATIGVSESTTQLSTDALVDEAALPTEVPNVSGDIPGAEAISRTRSKSKSKGTAAAAVDAQVSEDNETATTIPMFMTETTPLKPRKRVSAAAVVEENETAADKASGKNETATVVKRTRRSDEINVYDDESSQVPYQVYNVVRGNNYRFRLINAEFLNCPMELSIDNHDMTIIASDGSDLEPTVVSSFVSYAGERFDFVLQANQEVGNYWIRIRGLMDCDERFTSAYQVAILRYTSAEERDPAGTPTYDFVRNGVQLNALNRGTGEEDFVSIVELKSLTPDDPRLLVEEPDYKFYVYYDFYPKDNPHFHVPNLYGFNQIQNSSNKVFTPQLNHISLKMPSLPLMPAKDQLNDASFCNETSLKAQGIDCREEFCECTHVLQVKLNSVVEMILIDEGYTYDANHPFHLHGNAFRVVGMERLSKNISIEGVKALDAAGKIKRYLKGAPIKDTVTIPDGGYTIIRFVADNPGYWLFHCHIEFHAEIGMALVLKVGEPNEMKNVPDNFPTCHDYVPTTNDANVQKSNGVNVHARWSINLSYLFVIFTCYCFL